MVLTPIVLQNLVRAGCRRGFRRAVAVVEDDQRFDEAHGPQTGLEPFDVPWARPVPGAGHEFDDGQIAAVEPCFSVMGWLLVGGRGFVGKIARQFGPIGELLLLQQGRRTRRPATAR